MAIPLKGAKVAVNKAQIFPNYNKAVYCETFSCRTPAAYFIGRPDGPRMMWKNFCQNCMDSIITSIPDELLALAPLPEGMVLVKEDELQVLEGMSEVATAKEGLQTPDATATVENFHKETGLPWACPECERTFKTENALRTHGRSHKKQDGPEF